MLGGVMRSNQPEAEFTEQEIAQRRDDAIRRALNTPPTLQKQMVGKARSKGQRSRTIKKAKKQP
jgi:hypothetical protein